MVWYSQIYRVMNIHRSQGMWARKVNYGLDFEPNILTHTHNRQLREEVGSTLYAESHIAHRYNTTDPNAH